MDENKETRGSAFERNYDRVQENAAAAGQEAAKQAGEAAQTIKEQMRGTAEAQKTAGADQLSTLGKAVHQAAGELGKELPQAASYVHSVADQLETASSALRERSIEDLVNDFTAFAKQHQAAAFAGSVLAGFALARFLKSSRAQQG